MCIVFAGALFYLDVSLLMKTMLMRHSFLHTVCEIFYSPRFCIGFHCQLLSAIVTPRNTPNSNTNDRRREWERPTNGSWHRSCRKENNRKYFRTRCVVHTVYSGTLISKQNPNACEFHVRNIIIIACLIFVDFRQIIPNVDFVWFAANVFCENSDAKKCRVFHILNSFDFVAGYASLR